MKKYTKKESNTGDDQAQDRLLTLLSKLEIGGIYRFKVLSKEYSTNQFNYEVEEEKTKFKSFISTNRSINTEYVNLSVTSVDLQNFELKLSYVPEKNAKLFIQYQTFAKECLLSEETKKRILKILSECPNDSIKQKIYSNYYNFTNKWIFSYIEYLNSILVRAIIFNKLNTLYLILADYCKIEHWVLDNTPRICKLVDFDNYARLLTKAYRELESKKALSIAVNTIQKETFELYIQRLDKELNNPYDKRNTLLQTSWALIIHLNQSNNYWHFYISIFEKISYDNVYFDDSLRFTTIKMIEELLASKIENNEDNQLKKQLLQLIILLKQDSDLSKKQDIRFDLIRLIDLYEVASEYQVFKAQLVLSILSGRIDTNTILNWKNVETFSFETVIKNCNIHNNRLNDNHCYWYQSIENEGFILIGGGGFHIFPKALCSKYLAKDYHTLFHSVKLFEKSNIDICTTVFEKFNYTKSILQTLINWVNISLGRNRNKEVFPNIGECVYVRVNGFSLISNKMMVYMADARFTEMKGISHRLPDSFYNIVEEGDMLFVKVVKVDPNSHFFCFTFVNTENEKPYTYYKNIVTRQTSTECYSVSHEYANLFLSNLLTIWSFTRVLEEKIYLNILLIEAAKIIDEELAYYLQYYLQVTAYIIFLYYKVDTDLSPDIASIPDHILKKYPYIVQLSTHLEKCMNLKTKEDLNSVLYEAIGCSIMDKTKQYANTEYLEKELDRLTIENAKSIQRDLTINDTKTLDDSKKAKDNVLCQSNHDKSSPKTVHKKEEQSEDQKLSNKNTTKYLFLTKQGQLIITDEKKCPSGFALGRIKIDISNPNLIIIFEYKENVIKEYRLEIINEMIEKEIKVDTIKFNKLSVKEVNN